MCGINGILYRTSSEATRPSGYFHDIIDRMNKAILHRGPDGEGNVIQFPLCLGHRCPSIIDLSEHGSQPMFTADRSAAIVFNWKYTTMSRLPKISRPKDTHSPLNLTPKSSFMPTRNMEPIASNGSMACGLLRSTTSRRSCCSPRVTGLR